MTSDSLPSDLPRSPARMARLSEGLETEQAVRTLLKRLSTNTRLERGWAPSQTRTKNQMRRLHETIARHITILTPELLQWMNQHFRLQAGLIENPHLPEKRVRAFLHKGWQLTEQAQLQDDHAAFWRLEDQFYWGCDILLAFDRERAPLPASFQKQIFLDVLQDGKLNLSVQADSAKEALRRKRAIKRYQRVGQRLQQGNPDVFEAVARQIQNDPGSALQMIGTDAFPKKAARWLATRQQQRETINITLEQFPELMDDSEFFEMARSQQDPFVHAQMIEITTRPARATRLMEELVDIHPDIGASLLPTFAQTPGTELSTKLLSRLLERSSPQYRPDVLRISRQLKGPDSAGLKPER